MKILLFIFFTFLISYNEYSFAKDDKEFFISCSAKGNHIMTYKNQNFPEQLLDEYKIIIGKGDIIQGDRWPKQIILVNTNANREGWNLCREGNNSNIGYTERIIKFTDVMSLYSPGAEATSRVSISLISGVYEIFYKDDMGAGSNDKSQFAGLGKCNGLVPLLSYLENKSSSSSYLDYWWAVILIIAITFFIFTQSGKRLKKIRRK